MASKKSSVPEKSIDSGDLVELAMKALTFRAKAAEFTTQEKATSEEIAKKGEQERRDEIECGNYIGMIRVTGDKQAPIRIEFRLEKGALDVSEEANLDALYKGSRPVLFKREKVVTEILDPLALIQGIIAEGKNPFDFLELKVREGMDHVLVESKSVTSAEAFLPMPEFLSTIEGIKGSLSDDAKTFTKNYLEGALKPRVVLGTKGKA
jgi:hypothetical protein